MSDTLYNPYPSNWGISTSEDGTHMSETEGLSLFVHISATKDNIDYLGSSEENIRSDIERIFCQVIAFKEDDLIDFTLSGVYVDVDDNGVPLIIVHLDVDQKSITAYTLAHEITKIAYGKLYFKLIRLFCKYRNVYHIPLVTNNSFTLARYLGDSPGPSVHSSYGRD